MSDGESDDDVQLYSALERNRRQPKRMFVSLDSESESDDEWGSATPPRVRRKRKAASSPPSNGKKAAAKKAKAVDDEEEEEEDAGEADCAEEVTPKKSLYEDLLTPEELEAERERKKLMELEISLRLARDKTLSQTRAVMNKVSSFQTQAANAIELLDSDSDDDAVEIIEPPQQGTAPSSIAAASAAVIAVPAPSPSVRGERIKLHVRSNGGAIDEIAIHMNDSFDLLYTSFCDLHGLPRSAVKMTLDGEEVSLTGTPAASDLDTGDLIDAKVDFSQRVQENVKRYLRLRLVVFGKRAEPFRIDARSTVEKLHASFCAKHSISNPDDVLMSVNGQPLDLNEMIEFYGLIDGDEVSVQINNYVDAAAIPVQLRFEDGSSSVEHVLPSDRVQVLLEKIADLKQCTVSSISLRIDGETMAPALTFTHFDLEGDELIDVKMGQ